MMKKIEKDSSTSVGKPIEKIEYPIAGYDYIVVVGARTEGYDNSWGGIARGFNASIGTQYMFINQGIRQLSLYPQATADSSIQRVLVVCEKGYTKNDKKVINQYAQDHNARVAYVKNSQGLVNFLSQREEKKRLIKQLDFFSHGIVLNISLHYYGDSFWSNDKIGDFNANSVKLVSEKIFDYDAKITSYACRTGIAVDGDDLTGIDAKYKESLAQIMADTWEVSVFSFRKRSHYGKTYGTAGEVDTVNKIVSEHDKIMKKYERDSILFNNKQIKEEPIKPAESREYQDALKKQQRIIQREKNKNNDGGPIDPHGAWHKPGTAQLPKGLEDGIHEYKPQAWC